MCDASCAACGKGDDGLKTCGACKIVKYCSVQCQEQHRPSHKSDCKKAVRERKSLKASLPPQFRHIDTLNSDALFDPPPARKECPICFLSMPVASAGYGMSSLYLACCGQFVCSGCVHASNEEMARDNMPLACPFCRAPLDHSDDEGIRRCRQRIAAGCSESVQMLGFAYWSGQRGLTQDRAKALELWKKAAGMGSPSSQFCMAWHSHRVGDFDATISHYAAAAMGGHETSRHNLGQIEMDVLELPNRAMKHWMISASAGLEESLNKVREGFKGGLVSKDDYAKTLRSFKASQDELKSDQRAKAQDATILVDGAATLKLR